MTFEYVSSNERILTDDDGFKYLPPSSGSIIEQQKEFIATHNQTVFTLTTTPSGNSIPKVVLNGLELSSGIDNDYTITGVVITFNYGLDLGDKVEVNYF